MKRDVAYVCALFFAAMLLTMLHAQAHAQGPQETLVQYIADLQKNPNDDALREKIIKHVQTMRPVPAIPEEARRHYVMAKTLFDGAKKVEDYNDSITEFKAALLAAPWWVEANRDLGLSLEAAQQYDEAITYIKLYMATNPGSDRSRAAQDEIYKIEAKKKLAGKAAKESSQQASAEKKQMTDEELIRKINGARYTYSYRDETYGAGGENTIDVRENEAIYGIIITWTRDGKPIEGFPFGEWRQTSRGSVRGRQIIIPNQSWSYRKGSWFPHEPMICAIGENGSILTCNQTTQTNSQLTTTYRQQR